MCSAVIEPSCVIFVFIRCLEQVPMHCLCCLLQKALLGLYTDPDPICVFAQNRDEAQRAKDDLNGIMLHDNDLRIGWGKAIPIPSAPMFVLNPSGGVAPARGAAIAPPGALGSATGGAWGHPGFHDPATQSGMLQSSSLCFPNIFLASNGQMCGMCNSSCGAQAL